MPVFYFTPIWCPWKKVTTAVNKIKMKKGHWACNAEQISQSGQNEREKGTMVLLCGYIAPFIETMWEFSIFAGQLPRGLWKQFRREIKGFQNRFQAWMIKWTFCKTDFTELINGWLRLSHINKLRRSKIRERAENFWKDIKVQRKPNDLKRRSENQPLYSEAVKRIQTWKLRGPLAGVISTQIGDSYILETV